MLIQFDETSGTALGGNEQLSRSHMREGASRNPAIQLRADPPSALVGGGTVSPRRNDGASLLSSCRAALIDIAALLSAALLVSATGVGVAFAVFVLLFMPL